MKKEKIHIADSLWAGKNCPICLTVIISGDELNICSHCGQAFHVECWEENGGCSVYGCHGAQITESKEAEAAFVSSNAWGGSKTCPVCKKEIKPQAIKCRFCGATFASRDIISEEEYKNREYEGKEYISARNLIIALLLLSATGILTPITVILSAILLFGGTLGKVKYRRLSTPLKLILKITFGINIVLVLLMMFFYAFDK